MFDKPKNYRNLTEIFTDYLLFDIKNNSLVREKILLECYSFLISKNINDDDYLLFDIQMKFDKVGDCLTLKGNNLISSLWLIGVYPDFPDELKDKFTYSVNNIEYIYNPKNKKLTINRK